MDMSEHERRRLIRIEASLIVDAPRLQRAFCRWSAGPLRGDRTRTAVRAALGRPTAWVVLSMIVLGGGVALLALGLVESWLAAAVAGLVTAQFGPWLVARSARAHITPIPHRRLALR